MKIEYHTHTWHLKNFAQHGSISYQRGLRCNCGYARYDDNMTFDIVGYANTDYGYMAIFECKKCFEKYKHHMSRNKRSEEEFKDNVANMLFNQYRKLTK